MSEVKDVVFEVSNISKSSNKKVTVSYKLAFTSAEAGKYYKIAINLFGDDSGELNEPPIPFFMRQPLYTFTFGQFPAFQNYQTVLAQAGVKSYSVSRDVSSEKLDEDPGKTTVNIKPPGIPGPPQYVTVFHPDEVYAVVSLTSDSISATQKIPV